MEDARVKAPTWKWEWNLNTIMQLITIASIIFGGGWVLAEQKSAVAKAKTELDVLSTRVNAIEVSLRKVDMQELRLTNVEKNLGDTASSLRSLESSVNNLGSDVKVVKEILQRLEAAPRRP